MRILGFDYPTSYYANYKKKKKLMANIIVKLGVFSEQNFSPMLARNLSTAWRVEELYVASIKILPVFAR